MVNNIRGDIIVFNNKVLSAKEFTKIPVDNLFYEVVRLIEGRFIFLDDHLRRLENSCKKFGVKCPDKKNLKHGLTILSELSDIKTGNVKIIIFEKNEIINQSCFFIPHKYPSEEDYIKGVKLQTFKYERPDPNIKKWNEDFRDKVNEFIKTENIYEAALINKEGFITEGSRSNIFFTNNDRGIWTAPQKYILPGITRKYVFLICEKLDISINEKLLAKKDLAKMTGCFISGTSPKILPVNSLDEINFIVSNEIVGKIMKEYDKLLLPR